MFNEKSARLSGTPNYEDRFSVIAVLGLNGIIAPMVYKGTMNGDFFGGYIEQFLAPAMKKGDTLILDSLSAHKVQGVLDRLSKKVLQLRSNRVIPRISTRLNLHGQKSRHI